MKSNDNFLVNQTIDVCSFLSGTENQFFKWLLDTVGISHNQIHPCPYVGIFSLLNLTISNELTVKLPAGKYLGISRFFDDSDDNIITVRHVSDNLVERHKSIKITSKQKQV